MNHYSVDTGFGKIQLTKGAYLTMLKRKQSAVRTLPKHKPITSIHKHQKRTVKKPLTKSIGRSLTRQTRHHIMMVDCHNNPHKFELTGDKEIFNTQMMLPSIDMIRDNDTQSEWGDIDDNVKNLTLSLSIAAYDHHKL